MGQSKMNLKKLKLRRRLSIADGLFIVFGTFVLLNGLLGSGIFPTDQLAALLPGGVTVVNRLLVQQTLQTVVMLGLTLFFLYPLRGSNLRQIGLRPLANQRWIGRAVGLGVLTFFVMTAISMMMTALLPQMAEPQNITTLIMRAQNTWEWIAVLLMVSVMAPLSEEILFRGYIYHSLRNYYSVNYSILVASLLFGAVHYDLFRLLPLTLVGICLNMASVRANSLWASIIMHSTWNFITAMLVLMV